MQGRPEADGRRRVLAVLPLLPPPLQLLRAHLPQAGDPAAGGAAAAPAEEKTEFDVVLKEIGASKLNVIKVVRELTGLGLVEAKNMVESAPSTIKEAQPKELAEQMVAKLKEAGAVAELL